MSVTNTQMNPKLREIIDQQLNLYKKKRSVTVRNSIPETTDIPLDNQLHWLRIPDVVCVFVDMKNSTQLSATKHEKGTSGIYHLFTNTAILIFHEFEAPYIDVRGDGVFALFNSNQVYRAIAAAVSFKTFADVVFAPTIKDKTDLEVGAHIGIDQKTVLVRRMGLRRQDSRTDRQNEVWAGKPVNMASKLASMGQAGELIVSDRYYERITHDLVRLSCSCGDDEGKRVPLWKALDVSKDQKFDFDTAYVLHSNWCSTHGEEYCEAILALDD